MCDTNPLHNADIFFLPKYTGRMYIWVIFRSRGPDVMRDHDIETRCRSVWYGNCMVDVCGGALGCRSRRGPNRIGTVSHAPVTLLPVAMNVH